MSKLFAILFSGLILVQSFNLNLEDLSKMHVLLEHASFHQETYGDSFVDFITEHYTNNNLENNEDHDEHSELPFKKDHQTCHHANTSFTISQLNFELNNKLFIEVLFDFCYRDSLSLFEKSSIFQPPQIA